MQTIQNPTKWFTEAEARCRTEGLALTVQRRAVLRQLAGRTTHPTAENVLQGLSAEISGMSRTTVYRILETFVRLGILRKVPHEEAVTRYDPQVERHHHLICKACGAVVDLPDLAAGPLDLTLLGQFRIQADDYFINFTGLCSHCFHRSPTHPSHQGESIMAQQLKGSKTHDNLKAAFAGESQANRRYLYFAKVADIEGYPEIASNFRETAEGETGHAHGHLDYLKPVGDPATGLPMGDTAVNLESAVAGETHEYTDMYPGMAKTARDEGFAEIADWFETLAKAEKSHAQRFASLLKSIN